MSMMFKPPPEARIGWRDLFRIGPEDDPFWQQVRSAQLSFMERHLPMNIPVALVNGGVVLATIAADLHLIVLVYWLVTQLGSIVLALWQQWHKRHAAQAHAAQGRAVTRAEMRALLVQLFIVGSGWGVLYFDALGSADHEQAMLIIAMTMAGTSALAFSTANFPLGTLVMPGIVALGTLAGLFVHGWADGVAITLVIVSFLLFVARGNMLFTQSFLSRMMMQERLQEQEEVLRLLLNEYDTNGSEWLFEFDAAGYCTFMSSRFADATGVPLEHVIGTHWQQSIVDQQAAAPLAALVARGEPYRDMLLPVRIGGEDRFWSLSGTPKFDGNGELLGYRGVGSDVTDQQRAAMQIAELATFDALTGLVNRRVLHRTIVDGLAEPAGAALLFIDLDHFKHVNDTLGHAAGDRLLADVAARLRDVVHAAGPRALVGRLGGDEFAVVLHGAGRESAIAIGRAIIASLSLPYVLAGKQALIGASIGLAFGPGDGADLETLMRAADLALYEAKSRGRGAVHVYDRLIHQRVEERRALELDLRLALAAGQMRLAFQPIVDSRDERIVGFEALMRWRHPERGDVPPSDFIPVAEQIGLISSLGLWALDEACRVATTWPAHVRVAVNLSSLQFAEPDLARDVARVLARRCLAPARLELELTESLFLDERAQTGETLAKLRALGVGLALDDFGTGYSSLGYLRKIAATRIKIDRSFVRASLRDGGESTAIIQAIIALADRFGMETTAEGTETRDEFEAMRRLGCAHAQGYYFGRPMSADETLRLLDRRRPVVELAEPVSPPATRSSAASGRSPEAVAPAMVRFR